MENSQLDGEHLIMLMIVEDMVVNNFGEINKERLRGDMSDLMMIPRLISDGFIEISDGRLRMTDAGWALAGQIRKYWSELNRKDSRLPINVRRKGMSGFMSYPVL